MMGFNQQPEAVVPNTGHEPVNVQPPTPGPVYTMPDRFHPQAYHSSNKPLIVAALALVVVVLGVGAYFAYNYWNKMQAGIYAEEQRSQQAIIADLNTVPPPVNLPVAPTITTTTVATTTVATTTVATTTIATTTATTTPVVSDISTPAKISPDTDRDGLTDVEEQVVGTSSTNPDTDNDTYRDGLEIANSYSPITTSGSSASSKLADAKFVLNTTTSFTDGNFTTLIPTGWTITPLSANRQLTVTAATGEIIKITSKPNTQSLSPSMAMLQVYPQLTIGQLTPITAGQLTGVVSPNGQVIYLVDQGRSVIYTIEYIKDPTVDWRYPALFMMIAKNMKVIDQPTTQTPQVPAATNTTTSTNGQ